MSIADGDVDYHAKDDTGNTVSKEAAEHMSKYRVRCRECSLIFCTKCKEEPYHLGKTCEQYKEYKN